MKTGGIATAEDGKAAVLAVTGIQLGATYRDMITGFEGIAIGHCRYLTGCNQTLLQPATEDSKVRPEAHWFDDQRLTLNTHVAPIVLDNGTTPGCDKPAPTC